MEVINRRTDRLGPDYDDLINKEKLTLPRLVNKQFFARWLHKFTHYCLEKAIVELAAAKVVIDTDLKDGKVDFEFDPDAGCQLECKLLLRYGIPCKCWMTYFYWTRREPIPANLVDP